MVRWLRWHCPPDTRFEIRAPAIWGRARYLSVTEAPHNTEFHEWMGKKHLGFFQTAEPGKRTPNSGVEGSGANHYPRAPALIPMSTDLLVYFYSYFINLLSNCIIIGVSKPTIPPITWLIGSKLNKYRRKPRSSVMNKKPDHWSIPWWVQGGQKYHVIGNAAIKTECQYFSYAPF